MTDSPLTPHYPSTGRIRKSNRAEAAVTVLVLIAHGLTPLPIRAQQAPPPPGPGLRVFLDSQAHGVDSEFLRTEIDWVDWMRDRRDADVHLLVTAQSSGSGGSSFTFDFIGLRLFEGRNDTITYASSQTDTEDEVRREIARTIRLGLVPYLLRGPARGRLDLRYEEAEGARLRALPAEDPWDFWVFRTGLSGSTEGEESNSQKSLEGSFSARRITEAWKTELSLDAEYAEEAYKLEDHTVKEYIHDLSWDGLLVKSLGPHWSAGLRASANSSTSRNQRLSLRLAPAIEYNIYPYREFTRRQLTLQYSIARDYFDYNEETIYLCTEEYQFDQALRLSLNVTQPWGTAWTSLEASHYFSDINRYRLSFFSNLDIRLFRGLSLDLFASGSKIHDQLFIPSRGATDEEILLEIRDLQTSYNYEFRIGLSYTFGSIFNPIVNPRLASGGEYYRWH